MTIVKSFGSLLVATTMTLGAAGLAHAQPAPLTKVLAGLPDIGKALTRMAEEREEAEAARAKAQAELDALAKAGKDNPQAKEEAARLKKQIDDADARIRQITTILEGRRREPPPRDAASSAAAKAEMDKLMKQRTDTEAELTRAKAAYDTLSKQASPIKDRSDDAQKQIQGANAKIQKLNDALRQIHPMEFSATTEDEASEASELPKKLESLKQTLFGPHRLGNRFTIEQSYSPDSKQGTITIHWRGNP
jgi:chromosome segregation ATPase